MPPAPPPPPRRRPAPRWPVPPPARAAMPRYCWPRLRSARHASRVVDLAQRLEQEGFTGIYCPSPGDGLALCHSLALVTREIAFGTSIAHLYTRHPLEYAQAAAIVHELSGGRFRFGIGVSHGPAHERL